MNESKAKPAPLAVDFDQVKRLVVACECKLRQWANIPYNMEVRLEVDDKANSAGIVIDAIRLAKIALDRGIGGPIRPASAYLMKHPIEQMPDVKAKAACESFVSGE